MSFERKIESKMAHRRSVLERTAEFMEEEFSPIRFACPALGMYIQEKFNNGCTLTKGNAPYCRIVIDASFFREFDEQYADSEGNVKPYTFNELKYFTRAEFIPLQSLFELDKEYKLGDEIKGDPRFYIPDFLKEITFPDSMTEINGVMFSSCNLLEKIVMPRHLVRIYDAALKYNPNLTDIVFSPELRKIGKYAFANAISLVHVRIPDSVDVMGDGAFSECINLKSVIISNGMKFVPDSCFKDDVSLEDVYIPDSVKDIEDYAFAGCNALRKIRFPKSIEQISFKSFDGCSAVEEIEFQKNDHACINIRLGAFHDMFSLRKVIVHSDVDFDFCSFPESLSAKKNGHGMIDLYMPDDERIKEFYRQSLAEGGYLNNFVRKVVYF